MAGSAASIDEVMNMRILGLGLAILLLLAAPASSQMGMGYTGMFPGNGYFYGGLGMGFIDGQSYVTFSLRPELAIGKIGIGLDVNLRYNTATGELRREDWDTSYDILRAIRYVRYGRKRDPFYTRVGTLDAARLGHGFIMNFYNNELVYDERKVGLELDVDTGPWGFESMTSNLGRLEIVGLRGFYRPLYGALSLPVLRSLAVGATVVSDTDPDQLRATDDGVTIYGVDIDVPIIEYPVFRTAIYAAAAKISRFGSGKTIGVEVNVRTTANLLDVTARLERRFLGKQFIPSYFGPFYEIERYNVDASGVATRKTDRLAAIQTETRGIFGALFGRVANLVQLFGTFERLDERPESGELHLSAFVPKTVPSISARAVYNKSGIGSLGDVFSLDERSQARAGLGYRVNPFVVLFLDYVWTFRLDPATGRYVTQRRVEPQVAIVFPLNFGGAR
jgi:hypothetical protein